MAEDVEVEVIEEEEPEIVTSEGEIVSEEEIEVEKTPSIVIKILTEKKKEETKEETKEEEKTEETEETEKTEEEETKEEEKEEGKESKKEEEVKETPKQEEPSEGKIMSVKEFIETMKKEGYSAADVLLEVYKRPQE